MQQAYVKQRAALLTATPPGRLTAALTLHAGLIPVVSGIVCDYIFDSVSFPAIRRLCHEAEAAWNKAGEEYTHAQNDALNQSRQIERAFGGITHSPDGSIKDGLIRLRDEAVKQLLELKYKAASIEAGVRRLQSEAVRLRTFIQFCAYCKLPPEAYATLSQHWHAGETGFNPPSKPEDTHLVIRFWHPMENSVAFDGTIFGELMANSPKLTELLCAGRLGLGIHLDNAIFRSTVRSELRSCIHNIRYGSGLRRYYTAKNHRGSIDMWKRLIASGHTFVEAAVIFGLLEFSSSAYEIAMGHHTHLDVAYTRSMAKRDVNDGSWWTTVTDYERIMEFNRHDDAESDDDDAHSDQNSQPTKKQKQNRTVAASSSSSSAAAAAAVINDNDDDDADDADWTAQTTVYDRFCKSMMPA